MLPPMENSALKYLNPLYAGENQLQAINHRAAAIERDTGVSVVRCHLGNPLGPQFKGTNQLLSHYYDGREERPGERGYTDVAGEENILAAIAFALTKINRLPEGSITGKNIIGVNGGTGALNVALSIFTDPTILVTVSKVFKVQHNCA